jgi:hypothetical protein
MKIVRNQQGQFIIIAVMLIAIMMVSLSVTLYNASTYYESEKWDEYITLMDHVKLNTVRVVESSLANYTGNPTDPSILDANLQRWQEDLRAAYPGQGVVLAYELSTGVYSVQGRSVNYTQGLALSWNEPTSLSAANATFTLSFASIGLEGYRFRATPSLSLKILNVTATDVFAVIKSEDVTPIRELGKAAFTVAGATVVGVTSYYDPTEALIYKIVCDHSVSLPAVVTVLGPRGITVTARS